uniref:Integral membrane protein GPR137B-like n=1 Tax=Hirondellea gigas TaxID=1518452 RepID=A0A6A7G5V4_9CRUS
MSAEVTAADGSLWPSSDVSSIMDYISVKEILTYISLGIYGSLFLYIYLQLWLVLKYNYKKWCYRTHVMFCSLIWAALRITLFSYHWMIEHRYNTGLDSESSSGVLSRRVGYVVYFLLYSLPLYFQFTCLCIMVAYFYQIYRSSRNNFHPSELGEWKWPSYAILTLNLVLLCVNVSSSMVIKWQQEENYAPLPGSLPPSAVLHDATSLSLLTVSMIHMRVFANGVAFLLIAGCLAYLTRKVAKTSEARLLLETEHLTQRSAVLVCVLLVFLYLFRTIINFLALLPAVSFVLDTDQADLLSDGDAPYVMFVSLLFLWELTPTFIMVVFFRVKHPDTVITGDLTDTRDLLHDNTGAQFLTDSLSDGSGDEDLHGYYNSCNNNYNNGRYTFHYAGNPNATSPSIATHGRQGGSTLLNSSGRYSNLQRSSSNHGYYGYEVVEPNQHHYHHVNVNNNNSWLPVAMSRNTRQSRTGTYHGFGEGYRPAAPSVRAGNVNSSSGDMQNAVNSDSGIGNDNIGNVHPLSTRFTHRTSLFSYRILNRTNYRR